MKITRRRLRFLIQEALDDLEKKTQADLKAAGLDIPDDELESYLDKGTSTHYDDFIEKYNKAMKFEFDGVVKDEAAVELFKDALRSAPDAMISSLEYNNLYNILVNTIRYNSYYSSYHPAALLRQTAVDLGADFLGVDDPQDLIKKEVEDYMKEFKKPTYKEKRYKESEEAYAKKLGKKHDYKKVSFFDEPLDSIFGFTRNYNKSLEDQQKMIDKQDREEQELAITNLEKEMKSREEQNKLKQLRKRMQSQKQ